MITTACLHLLRNILKVAEHMNMIGGYLLFLVELAKIQGNECLNWQLAHILREYQSRPAIMPATGNNSLQEIDTRNVQSNTKNERRRRLLINNSMDRIKPFGRGIPQTRSANLRVGGQSRREEAG